MSTVSRVRRRLFGEPLTSCRIELLRRMPKDSVCAEVGVYKGDFSAHILKVVRPRKLHLIDPWYYETEPVYSRTWYGGNAGKNQLHMDSLFQSVQKRFEPQIAAGIVVLHRGKSHEVLPTFDPEYFDWVYIDGNHSYGFVRDDLSLSMRALKPHGLLAGDDYHLNGWWGDGVIRAVDEARTDCATKMILDGQFILEKPAQSSQPTPLSYSGVDLAQLGAVKVREI